MAEKVTVKETLKELDEGVKALFESGKFQDYLSFMGKFHNYSANNSLLIWLQKPDATLVAGFSKWKELGRSVDKGEKGIRIVAPAGVYKQEVEVKVKNEKGQEESKTREIEHVKFRHTFVYDVSQTSGKELPDMLQTKMLDDNSPYIGPAIESATCAAGIPVTYQDITDTGAKGYYSRTNNEIVIQEGMSKADTLSVLIHEIAHSKMHSKDQIKDMPDKPTRSDKEVQAESVAFAVCKHFGLDTGETSFGYVAGWAQDKKLPQLKKALEVISKTSMELIQSIEAVLPKIELETVNYKEAIAVIKQQTDYEIVTLPESHFAEHDRYSNVDSWKQEIYMREGINDRQALTGLVREVMSSQFFTSKKVMALNTVGMESGPEAKEKAFRESKSSARIAAYTVCRKLGLEQGYCKFGKVENWKEIQKSPEVQEKVSAMLDTLEKAMPKREQKKETQKAAER